MSKRRKKVEPDDEFDVLMQKLKKTEAEQKLLNVADIKSLQKDFKNAVENSKRNLQKHERKKSAACPSRTRSGLRRGAEIPKDDYTTGKLVSKGMDDAQESFDKDECEFLKKAIKRIKAVRDLKTEHIHYLVAHELLDELKQIKEEKINSEFHNRFKELEGKSKNDLLSEVRTSLFTNDQRDYLNGLLQGLFEANKRDKNGDIKHSEICYVNIVMLAEATTRIVRLVHKLETLDETIEFMKKKSREAHGIFDDDYD